MTRTDGCLDLARRRHTPGDLTYAHAVDGQEAAARERIEQALAHDDLAV